MAKASKAWGAIADQTARLAEEGRQISKPVASKPDEAIAAQPHTSPGFRTPADWAAKEAAEKQAPAAALIAAGPKSEAVPISKVEKKSTSLYLSGAASRAIKTLAASRGIRPHRVIDEALAEYLARPENGGLDFHALNAKD